VKLVGNVVALAAGVVLLLAGCSDGAGSNQAASATSSAAMSAQATPTPPTPTLLSTPTEETASGTTITSGDSEYGPMLFDANQQAIYIWEVEDSSTPECYNDCADAWPPVLTDGEPVADGDVDPELLGTTQRDDGTRQVTYNDHPLYFYAHEAPGEVECHNIATHGGLWWVVQPDGDRAP
jgi:predicted lipoprotein with Yx(FWY)xxD motif